VVRPKPAEINIRNLTLDNETMNLLSAFGLRVAPTSDTGDIYDLLIAVLPTFIALADDNIPKWPEASESGTAMLNFYLHFKVKMFNLHAVLCIWDPTEWVQRLSVDEDEVRNNLIRVLDELESRFLSWKSKAAGSACRRLGLERRKDETYSKLRALRRILPEDDKISEELVSILTAIIRIDNKSAEKRERLLRNLDEAFSFFYSLQPVGAESDLSCPIRFSDYPLKHLWKLTERLFDVIQKNWRCQCSSSPSHVSRKTRLNLTHHQRFETAPTKGQVIPNSRALFRILFPTTNALNAEWQDTEIAVNNRG
jgi:hypothetical protein